MERMGVILPRLLDGGKFQHIIDARPQRPRFLEKLAFELGRLCVIRISDGLRLLEHDRVEQMIKVRSIAIVRCVRERVLACCQATVNTTQSPDVHVGAKVPFSRADLGRKEMQRFQL
eukprot:Amastigsp_a676615_216.p3 type:complete len:117 gc:universal Amastigsp_a676615_216:315-665(+)